MDYDCRGSFGERKILVMRLNGLDRLDTKKN
jgi:hypothetical protein